MNTNPCDDIRISVLIPVYNVERYLHDCINSVLKQTQKVYEIVLVDDGSTDSSGLICDEYADNYPLVKVFHKENGGSLSARMYAISRANGNWFMFLDSDDTLKINAVEIVQKSIRENNPDCVLFGLDRVSKDKIIQPFIPELPNNELISDKGKLYELVFTHNALNSLCRKAVRAELLSDDYSAYYNISLAEDLLQSLEIYRKAHRFYYICRSLYNYTYNETSITNTISIDNYKIDFTVREMVYEFIKNSNTFTLEQWNTYNNYSLRLFINQIKTVLAFNAKHTDIKILLDRIKRSDYYQHYIRQIKKYDLSIINRLILMGFKTNNYHLLLIINSLYRLKKGKV